MEQTLQSSASGGDIPSGIELNPSDEDLLVRYLENKIAGRPFPTNLVVEADVYGDKEPWNLVGEGPTPAYFFSKRTHRWTKTRRLIYDRKAGNGKWSRKKEGIKEANIIAATIRGQKITVGRKIPLSFYLKGSLTVWVMHEYELCAPINSDMSEEWVLCRIKKSEQTGTGKRKRDRDDAAGAGGSSSANKIDQHPPAVTTAADHAKILCSPEEDRVETTGAV